MATMKVIQLVSEMQRVPIIEWLKEGSPVKFVDDDVDKKKGVCDMRSELLNMYSILAVKERVPLEDEPDRQVYGLKSFSASSFLPNKDDVLAIRRTLTVLVARILCKHIKCLSQLSKQVPAHISHDYSDNMAQKSDVFFLDVLMKNEALHSDMVDIILHMHDYLGEDNPLPHKVLSGGDQLTCERQTAAQRHRMDGDSPREQLQLVEPQCEDWHALMCFLKVCCSCMCMCELSDSCL